MLIIIFKIKNLIINFMKKKWQKSEKDQNIPLPIQIPSRNGYGPMGVITLQKVVFSSVQNHFYAVLIFDGLKSHVFFFFIFDGVFSHKKYYSDLYLFILKL